MRLSQRSPLRLGEICEIFRPGGGDEAEPPPLHPNSSGSRNWGSSSYLVNRALSWSSFGCYKAALPRHVAVSNK